MLHRTHRAALLGLFIFLQAMAPFIHAHAGAGAMHHAGFLHVHAGVAHGEPGCHRVTADGHGVEIALAAGMPTRDSMSDGMADGPPVAALRLQRVTDGVRCQRVQAAVVPWHPEWPDYVRPPALAPPTA